MEQRIISDIGIDGLKCGIIVDSYIRFASCSLDFTARTKLSNSFLHLFIILYQWISKILCSFVQLSRVSGYIYFISFPLIQVPLTTFFYFWVDLGVFGMGKAVWLT